MNLGCAEVVSVPTFTAEPRMVGRRHQSLNRIRLLWLGVREQPAQRPKDKDNNKCSEVELGGSGVRGGEGGRRERWQSQGLRENVTKQEIWPVLATVNTSEKKHAFLGKPVPGAVETSLDLQRIVYPHDDQSLQNSEGHETEHRCVLA